MNPPDWGPLDRHAMRQYCATQGVHHLNNPTLNALLTIIWRLRKEDHDANPRT